MFGTFLALKNEYFTPCGCNCFKNRNDHKIQWSILAGNCLQFWIRDVKLICTKKLKKRPQRKCILIRNGVKKIFNDHRLEKFLVQYIASRDIHFVSACLTVLTSRYCTAVLLSLFYSIVGSTSRCYYTCKHKRSNSEPLKVEGERERQTEAEAVHGGWRESERAS